MIGNTSRCRVGIVARVGTSNSGVAAVEFALLAPTFFLLMLGTFDIGQMVYGQAVLNGAVQAAARSSALETADTTVADENVENAVRPILPGATVTSERQSYFDFADISRAEAWNDSNNSGMCDNSESYTDENANGSWDEDIGISGNGGAGDVVLYTVTVTYEPFFTLPFSPSDWSSKTITSTAVRKNQPFGDQQEYSSQAGTCV